MAEASFPNNKKIWIDKQDYIDTVMASHMNDAYAEIIAIEDTLINGLPISKGGTGATTKLEAQKSILPDQTTNNGKVLKTDGTNAYWDTESLTSADRTKLDGIATGATKTESSITNGNIKINGTETIVYTHPVNHPATLITGLATVATTGNYTDLTNTPIIPTSLPANGGNADTLDGKHANEFATLSTATSTTAGLMSSTDKLKLDSLSGNYIHPESHAAMMIEVDVNDFTGILDYNAYNAQEAFNMLDTHTHTTLNGYSASTSSTNNTLALRDGSGALYVTKINASISTGEPITVNSTTKVSNLNADLLDGQHGSYYQPKPTTTNTSYGDNAGVAYTSAVNNVAIGYNSLDSNTSGTENTAIGSGALQANSISSYNTAVGKDALYSSTGTQNTAIGRCAMSNIGNGSYNTAIGYNAGRYIADGSTSNSTSQTSIYIGNDTKANANGNSNEIVIGYNAIGYGSNTAHIGDTNIATISFGAGTGTAFTNRSDRRLKEDITDADTSICYNDIKTLPLHRFKYKNYVGNTGDQHLTGFIADEFEVKFPKAVTRNDQMFPLYDENGQPVMKTILDEDGNETQVQEYFTMEQVASIDTSQVVTTLVGCTQHLMKMVENLQAEIETLKNS